MVCSKETFSFSILSEHWKGHGRTGLRGSVFTPLELHLFRVCTDICVPGYIFRNLRHTIYGL